MVQCVSLTTHVDSSRAASARLLDTCGHRKVENILDTSFFGSRRWGRWRFSGFWFTQKLSAAWELVCILVQSGRRLPSGGLHYFGVIWPHSCAISIPPSCLLVSSLVVARGILCLHFVRPGTVDMFGFWAFLVLILQGAAPGISWC